MPVLYLHDGRAAAGQDDRTLYIDLTGLPASSGVEAVLTSWHQNVATGDRHRESHQLVLSGDPCTTDLPCTAPLVLNPDKALSDFYRLTLLDDTGQLIWTSPSPERPDLVVLDTWDVPRGMHVVRITYATLFEYARGHNDLANRLPPAAVTDYIEHVFVPAVRESWDTQLLQWRFGNDLQPDWDADGVIEITITTPPFALFGGTGTYSQCLESDGEPTREAHIWWFATNNDFQAYTSLEDGTRSVLAHEFFHLAQCNVFVATQRSEDRWMNVVIEAQAKFAASVQYPDLELGRQATHPGAETEYGGAANRYLRFGLNTSYRTFETDPVNRYDAALYWRFLYEQAGDMGVIRASLSEMGRRTESDIVTGLPRVMDRVFAALDGPFPSFEESLTAFAAANYALRLRSPACRSGDLAQCGQQIYQTDGAYADPPLEADLTFEGAPLSYRGTLPTSYGMDFIEIALAQTPCDRTLTLTMQGEGTEARFHAQLWRIALPLSQQAFTGDQTRDEALLSFQLSAPAWPGPSPLTSRPEIVPEREGLHTVTLTCNESGAYNKLALIITRLDAHETEDRFGAYLVSLTTTGNPAAGF